MKDFLTRLGIGGLLITLIYWLGYETLRSDFPQLITLYGAFFLFYLGVFHFSETKKTITFFVGIGIFARFLLLFTLPNFSDDLYRFIWDGRLLTQGINPFDHLPSHYIDQNSAIPGLTTELYEQLNSPDYFTIYPPVNQVIFAMATGLFPNSIWGSSLVMKSCLFAFEIGSVFLIIQLLQHFKLPAKNVLLYALNPLIIIEITGNIHFEGAMIFFLLLAIWLIATRNKWILSAIVFALSVASKLLPLMFLPLMIRRIGKRTITEKKSTAQIGIGMLRKGRGENKNRVSSSNKLLNFKQFLQKRIVIAEWFSLDWKKVIAYFAIIGFTLGALFIPLINGVFLTNFGDSLNLYFQKFEFNGSLYYCFRWIGFQVKGYNIIGTLGPVLALSALTGIILITLLEEKTDWTKLFERMLFAVCCYLFCSATVHPWYVAMPIVFCVFTRYRFPILWSGLIFLTYINYSYEEYFENLWVVGIEYVLVFGYLIFEFISKKD
ncbi:MAG: hypothetical protein AB8G86_15460 [Saprospiraceae bacterium]